MSSMRATTAIVRAAALLAVTLLAGSCALAGGSGTPRHHASESSLNTEWLLSIAQPQQLSELQPAEQQIPWPHATAAQHTPRHRPNRRADGSRAAAHGCLAEKWWPQRVDHFARARASDAVRWPQRVLVCDRYWQPGGSIWFYAGGEADIELYANSSGLLWENAADFNALLVFAEHRYYGQSGPFGARSWEADPTFLTSEQALADFATVIWALKHGTAGAIDSPVIAFGGSYAGLMALWLRVKYPHLVDGAVAASAPVLAFPGLPGFNPSSFWKVVTYSASPAAGCAPTCANLTAAAFRTLLSVKDSPQGRLAAGRFMKLCKPLKSAEDVVSAAYWAQSAFDAFAMGNYPFPSAYMSDDPEHPLPAWPMQVACMKFTRVLHHYQSELLDALAQAAGVMYNASGTVPCFDLQPSGPAAADVGPWDFQVCTEQMAQEQPYFPATGVTDMFWDQGQYNGSAIAEHCKRVWGAEPEPGWAATLYGGADVLRQTSNVVLSNGLLDPWSAFGVLANVSDNVVAVVIPEGAHHVDLMWSSPYDTPSIREARRMELQHVRAWIDAASGQPSPATEDAAAAQAVRDLAQSYARHPTMAGKRLLIEG